MQKPPIYVFTGPSVHAQCSASESSALWVALGSAAAISGLALQQGLDPAADDGHALRIAARVKALASVQTTRFDTEGLASIDLEVQSDAAWKSRCRALPHCLQSLARRGC